MAETYDELFDFFELYGEASNKKYVLMDNSPSDYKFYNDSDDYGVFVVTDDIIEFRESCSGIVLESKIANINNAVKKGYLMTCSVSGAHSEFASVCESLIQTDRKVLAEDPSQWFDKWKETFGNANVFRNTYPVIGELLVLKKLRENGYPNAIWGGPDASVCDISDPESGMYFEVKSTIVRNSSSVTLSEEFQSKKADYLCFCRFEEDPSGQYSIESVISELGKSGYDRKSLDTGLRKLKIRDTSLKTLRYDLLEMEFYPVEGNVPDIMQFFVGGEKPQCIEKVSYTVNLSGLKHQTDVPVKTYNRNE